jgi:hypothetical protein
MIVNTDYMRLVGEGVIETIVDIHRRELGRYPTSNEINSHYLWHFEGLGGHWHAEDIENFVRNLQEWKDKHQAPSPIFTIKRVGNVVRFGQRAITDDNGPFLTVGLSRFYWLWAWKFERDRVLREMDSDIDLGYSCARVLAQVGDPNDQRDFWTGKIADYRWPDHEELVAGLTNAAITRGFRILWTFIGKGGPIDQQSERRAYVRRMSDVLSSCRKGVFIQEIMNEPMVSGHITLQELLELHEIAKKNSILTATGAVWTEKGWVENNPNYEGATGFSPEGWAATQRDIGIAHLDRDTSKGEKQDRPWRQAWDVGLESMPWIDLEHIGPGSSVNSETRANVLRSHRTVAFISRAFASCFHSKAGVRGDIPMIDMPGYKECPQATRFLPPDLPNGQQQNANEKFPNRHWDVDSKYIRSEGGSSIVRAYGNQIGGIQYTVPFGIIADFEMRARKDLHVKFYQQRANEMQGEKDVSKDEVITLTSQCEDYLIVST